MSNRCRPGLDDRCRDENGEIRRKNGNTRVATLRETYGENFAEGRRSEMKLENPLDETGTSSLRIPAKAEPVESPDGQCPKLRAEKSLRRIPRPIF
jgi:hypothetical protein